MPRASLSAEAVVDIAMGLLDEIGPTTLTLSAVATRAGVATPSLYKHVRNAAELRRFMSERVMTEIADEIGQAVLGRSADEATRALMLAWRRYVVRHPHRYAALNQAPDPGTADTAERLVGIVLATLRAYGLTESDAIHAVRCLRAVVHGFAVLETEGAFGLPEKLDDTYDLLIRMVIAGLHTQN